jgi:hypothetical protein
MAAQRRASSGVRSGSEAPRPQPQCLIARGEGHLRRSSQSVYRRRQAREAPFIRQRKQRLAAGPWISDPFSRWRIPSVANSSVIPFRPAFRSYIETGTSSPCGVGRLRDRRRYVPCVAAPTFFCASQGSPRAHMLHTWWQENPTRRRFRRALRSGLRVRYQTRSAGTSSSGGAFGSQSSTSACSSTLCACSATSRVTSR